MKTSLASGHPFVVGISVYESFESEDVAKTGMVSMPDIYKETCLGGHAVLVVGYSDITQKWIVRNSWGDKWGDKGYFYLPYLYFYNKFVFSFHPTIQSVINWFLFTYSFDMIILFKKLSFLILYILEFFK